ncbi:MAG: UxaA family hydrolase [Gemmataceae bacterium]
MDTPGYDPVSMTGIIASEPMCSASPLVAATFSAAGQFHSIKIATNSPLYRHMIDDMDIDAGASILDGTPVGVGQQIFEEILAVASGKKTKSELNGVGEEEFAPWAVGPTL